MRSPHDLGTIFTNLILKDLVYLASIKIGSKPNFIDRSFSGIDWTSAIKRYLNKESRITCVHDIMQMVYQFREFVRLTDSTNELAHMLELLPRAIQGINNLSQTYTDTTSVKTSLHTIALNLTKLIKTIERKIIKLEHQRKKRKRKRDKKINNTDKSKYTEEKIVLPGLVVLPESKPISVKATSTSKKKCEYSSSTSNPEINDSSDSKIRRRKKKESL